MTPKFSEQIDGLSVDQLKKLLIDIHKMVIVKHYMLSSIYDAIEHLPDEFHQEITIGVAKALNVGTENWYDQIKISDIPMNRQYVSGVEKLMNELNK